MATRKDTRDLLSRAAAALTSDGSDFDAHERAEIADDLDALARDHNAVEVMREALQTIGHFEWRED